MEVKMDPAQKVLNRAKKGLVGRDAFTPFEVPAPLWELSPKLLIELLSLVKNFGFPTAIDGKIFMKLFLKTRERGIIPVLMSVPPTRFYLAVGNNTQPCFCIFIKMTDDDLGFVEWNRKIRVADVVFAMLDMEEAMHKRGLFDMETRKCANFMQAHRLYLSDDVFADKSAIYMLRDSWSDKAVLAKFADPDRLRIINTGSKRVLCLRERAKQAERQLLRDPLNLRADPDKLRREILAYDVPIRYS
ncbi:hypothetical protein GF391_00010 [Candidatus Uhrbacteria bacterium]|nr:hypothetical protein [Candidatus Uhrbacteria bacterium]